MKYTLGKNIEAGQQIKTNYGWRKIKSVGAQGAYVKEGLVMFGDTIYGWKAR